jgi:putative ABC transport system permease protein
VTAVAVISLALALAGNATVFSLVHALLYRPLPYPQAERIVFFGERSESDPRAAGLLSTVMPANYLDLAERQASSPEPVFEETAAFWGAALSLDAGGETPQPVVGGTVTPAFFRLFGARFSAGRGFTAEEGKTGGPRVAVLSGRFAADRYGTTGAQSIGDVLRLNGESYEVVGVLDEDFELLLAPQIQIWLPMVLDPGTAPREGRGIFGIGRLSDGLSLDGARTRLGSILRDLTSEYPEANRGRALEVLSLRNDLPDPRNRRLLAAAQGALLAVLLLACANLANLLLARGRRRRPEVQLRRALGARHWQVALQPLTESLLLALAGGLLGTALGALAIRAVGARVAPLLPSFWQPALDPRVVLYTFAVTVAAGLLVGLAPALQTGRWNLAEAIKEGAAASTGSRRLGTRGLVVAQVALATLLLAGTGMMVRGFQLIRYADPGFDTQPLLMLSVQLSQTGTAESAAEGRAQGSSFDRRLDRLLDRLAALPGARAATAANVPPRGPVVPTATLTLDAAPPADGAPPSVAWLEVHPSFFDTLGIERLQGRVFDARDTTDAPPVAVVNRALERRYWPRGSAVGERITLQGKSREVVGVVADARHDLEATGDAKPTAYLPLAQQAGAQASSAQASGTQVASPPAAASQPPIPLLRIVLAAAGTGQDARPATLADPARQAILAFDRDAAVSGITTVDAFAARFATGHQIFALLFGIFGALALGLAMLGIYGVLSFSVAQRTREIGLRMALGADRGRTLRLFLRQGLTLGLLGLALATPGIYFLHRILGTALGTAVPLDLPTLTVVVLLLLATLALATYLPARRAAAIQPSEALRRG